VFGEVEVVVYNERRDSRRERITAHLIDIGVCIDDS
jgi:hypothetical protein